MRSPARRFAALVAGLGLAGSCTAQGPAPGDDAGPVARSLDEAARTAGVPRDLLVAIAAVEGGLLLAPERVVRPDDDVPVAGALELRHGAFDSLARGAALSGTDEATLRAHTSLGTLAGALVLAELGRASGATPLADDAPVDEARRDAAYASWREAIATLSGIGPIPYRDDYLRQVYAALQQGGDHPAFGGERVHARPHPGVALPDATRFGRDGTPDYPGAIWFQTSCTNKCDTFRPDGNAAVDTIVIHDTEGGWNASVATLQNDAGKSVHYIVDADGSRVGQFVPETYTAWHAGHYCVNKHSIGIEHVGFASDPNGYSDGLYATSVKLVESIRKRWTVPLDRTHVIGHYQVANPNTLGQCAGPCTAQLDTCEHSADYGGADNHRDPGENWQWCQYMERLGGSCTCEDAWSLWNCTTDKTEAVRCHNGAVEIEQCFPCESMPVGTNDVCHAMAGPVDMAAARDLAATPDAAMQQLDAAVPQGSDAAVADAGAGTRDGGAVPDALQRADGAAASDGGHGQAAGGCQCAVSTAGGRGPGATLLGLALLALGLLRRNMRRNIRRG